MININTVQKYVESANRSLFVINTISLLLVATVLALSVRYLRNYLTGPIPISSLKLDAFASEEEPQKYYLSVKGEKLVETGYVDVTSSKSKTTGRVLDTKRAPYYVLILQEGNRLLLIKAPHAIEDPAVTGFLEPIPDDLKHKLLQDLSYSSGKFAQEFYPLMLNADENFRLIGHILLAVGVSIGVLNIWFLKKWNDRRINPLRHPGCKALSEYGEAAKVAEEINVELGKNVTKFKHLHITDSWVVSHYFTSLSIFNIQDCEWIYLKVTQNYLWFIPTVKNPAVVIKTRFSDELEIGMRKAQANEILVALALKAPWAYTGFNEKLAEAWKDEREAFHAAITDRKEYWLKSHSKT